MGHTQLIAWIPSVCRSLRSAAGRDDRVYRLGDSRAAAAGGPGGAVRWEPAAGPPGRNT